MPVFLHEPGLAENEEVRAIGRMFGAALALYTADCRDALHGSRMFSVDDDDHEAREEALADLTGDRAILRRFCDMLGLDVDETASKIAREIESSNCHLPIPASPGRKVRRRAVPPPRHRPAI